MATRMSEPCASTTGQASPQGFKDTDTLAHVLATLDEPSLTKLVKDHEAGKLAGQPSPSTARASPLLDGPRSAVIASATKPSRRKPPPQSQGSIASLSLAMTVGAVQISNSHAYRRPAPRGFLRAVFFLPPRLAAAALALPRRARFFGGASALRISAPTL